LIDREIEGKSKKEERGGERKGGMEGRKWWKVNYFIVVFPSVCKSSHESAKHTYCK